MEYSSGRLLPAALRYSQSAWSNLSTRTLQTLITAYVADGLRAHRRLTAAESGQAAVLLKAPNQMRIGPFVTGIRINALHLDTHIRKKRIQKERRRQMAADPRIVRALPGHVGG
jgi:hypothetical protein